MSQPQCPPCQPQLDCSDSAYSTAGNTMGILTFAYAVLATIWVYISRIRSADAEQRKLMDTAYANYVRWKLMINEYEDVLKAGGDVSGDFKELLQHRFQSGGEAMQRLDLALDYDLDGGTVKRTRQKGKFVLGHRELHELLLAAGNATEEVSVLLDGITQEQMHRELKLQHALIQQIAQKVGVDGRATEDMRRLVEEVGEGAPVASLLRMPPLTKENGGGSAPQLTVATAADAEQTPGDGGSRARQENTSSEKANV